MAAKLPARVVVQAGTTSAKGNGAIPNAGFKVAPTIMPKPQAGRKWLPAWHPEHPANQ